jgi:PAS domain S-box-containing protein
MAFVKCQPDAVANVMAPTPLPKYLAYRVEESAGAQAVSLAAPRELLEHVLDALEDGVLVLDAAGRRVYANDAAARLTGYSCAAELLAAPMDEAAARFEIRDRDGAPLDPGGLPGRRALAGEEPLEPVQVRFRAHGGPERVSEVRAVRIVGEAGALAYVVTFFREVTEQVEAADEVRRLYRAARETTALLDALYGSAPVGLGFWDHHLRYVRVNDALAAINERPAEDHVGRTFHEVVPQLAHELEPLARRVLETHEPVIGLEMTAGTPRHPDAIRYWSTSYYPVLGPDGQALGVGAVVQETTARRRAEQLAELHHRVTSILSSADAVEPAVAGVLEAICVTLGWDAASYWATEEPEAARITWARPGAALDGFLALTERTPLEQGMLPARVAAANDVEWLSDLTEEAFSRAPVADAEGLRSAVAFPVVTGGAAVATVEVFSKVRREPDEELAESLAALGRQLGQFLRRRRAEEERAQLLVRERSARADAEAAAVTLRKLERVSEAALAHLSLQDLLDALLARIVEVLEADTAAILLAADDDKLHVRATVGLEKEIELAVAIPIGAGMAGRVAASRRPLLVPDLSKIDLYSPVLRERGINSIVAIPLIVEDRVIGVVHAGSEAYAQFVEDDARLLELIADRIALAINQASLYDAERAAQQRLRFLGEASDLLASSLLVDETLHRVAGLAVPQFADWCAVDLVRPDRTLERVAVAHVDPEKVELARRLAAAYPATLDDAHGIGAVLRSGQAMLANEIDEGTLRAAYGDRPEYLQALLDLELRATMIVPLAVRDRTVGALTFVAAESRRTYSDADLAFAQELAARAAVAVENAQLYRSAQRRRDRLAFLAEASALLGASLDVERTLDQLGSLIAARFADWAAIHLLEGERVRLATVSNRDGEKAAAARAEAASLPPDRDAPSSVVEAIAGAATVRWDAAASGVQPGSLEAAEGIHSGLTVPLVARGRVLGTLSLARSETLERYDDDDVEFAEDLARRAAVAIDNAQLYREAAVGRDRLGFLAEASALLGASLDVERTLEQLGGLVAGRVADWCSIHLLAERAGVRLVSVAHRHETRTADARAAVSERGVTDRIGRVVREGRPDVGSGLLIAPLTARGRTFGTMTLGWDGAAVKHDDAAVEFAVDLARRAAVAIDNAQLYGAAAERAQAARVLASVGDGVFLVDRAGYIRTWNRAAAIATNLPAAAVVDRLAVEAIPGWAAIASRIAVSSAGSSAPRPESLPLDLGDHELWLSIHGVAVPDGVVYAFRDLTEERALEQMRTEFVSTVSHELRTPLAAIYGAAMTLRRNDVALDADQRGRLLDVVSGEADRLARTVNDILWASRLDSDSLHVTIQHCDPLELVDEVVKAQEAHLDRAHRLLLDAAGDLPPVAGDPDKVARVLINLVDNGIKYSPDGGRVTVSVVSTGSHVRFSVADEGLGIPPAEQRRIFEKFYRLDPNMNRGVGGTGLGLYICRELVRRMEGRIWVESPGLGRGSTFHVELPAAVSY